MTEEVKKRYLTSCRNLFEVLWIHSDTVKNYIENPVSRSDVEFKVKRLLSECQYFPVGCGYMWGFPDDGDEKELRRFLASAVIAHCYASRECCYGTTVICGVIHMFAEMGYVITTQYPKCDVTVLSLYCNIPITITAWEPWEESMTMLLSSLFVLDKVADGKLPERTVNEGPRLIEI